MPAPRLVCFDIGNVLVRLRRPWISGCAAVGLEVRGDISAALATDAWKELAAAYETGRLGAGAFVERFSAMIDGLYAPDEIMRVHRVYLDGEYDGAAALVARVRAAGVLTAALSNTCDEHWKSLPDYPALREMDRYFASHLLGLRKPDEAIYRAVEAETGLRGSEIAFFDDLEENVAAARALGWQAVRVDPDEDPPAQVAAALAEMGALTEA
jgi:putative hydrolase of the HAD superfamily